MEGLDGFVLVSEELVTNIVKTQETNIAQALEIKALKEELSRKSNTIDAAKSKVGSLLSQSQMNYIFEGKPVTRWHDDDISHAIPFRNLSRKAYKFLSEKWGVPCPSIRTLNRWIAKLDVEPGILESVFNLLKHKAEEMGELSRISCLPFDECSVSREWSYDKCTDFNYESHDNVAGAWTQLIYYDFDCPVTTETLFTLIEKAEAAGFPVVAMVNYLGPKNTKLWKSLGITTENGSFTNPAASERHVYVFGDAPHLVKLIRNNLLDHEFVIQEGSVIDGSGVRESVKRSIRDLKVTHRLSDKHVEVTRSSRMKVKLAVQLLSETIGKALQFFGKRGLLECKNSKDTSEFI